MKRGAVVDIENYLILAAGELHGVRARHLAEDVGHLR
jgi:hypothetical protein